MYFICCENAYILRLSLTINVKNSQVTQLRSTGLLIIIEIEMYCSK